MSRATDAGSGPLAHSPPSEGKSGDPYPRHVIAVRDGALLRLHAMLRHANRIPSGLVESVAAAALFHDLGKLDPDIQKAFKSGHKAKLKWDHIDAGVARLTAANECMAAWLVRAHHAPGLPRKVYHFDADNLGRRLRGRRNDDDDFERHEEQITRTDSLIGEISRLHDSILGKVELNGHRPAHGLTMRLALSCLVDADHSDTAYFSDGHSAENPYEARWEERLDALCRYVKSLPEGESDEERERNRDRAEFFNACLNSRVDDPIVSCEAPVGLGKTTAITAYLLRRAIDAKCQLRRLIIVAPYTTILQQTADRLRKALVLPGENPELVVMEHHHRADFDNISDRQLAVLWQAPVIVTTAVSFFETLAACKPSALRKLHSVPGSAIIIDEAHGSLPVELWPQNWLWLKQLAENWGCRIVLASGSLVRFWEEGVGIATNPVKLKELLPPNLSETVFKNERRRVRFLQPDTNVSLSVEELLELACASPGPRLVILNTVQNAAIVAKTAKGKGLDVLHLSTALTPRDREKIVKKVEARLKDHNDRSWTLVATSCVEAGVDFSFRTAFRESFSVASLIQVGGRVNRHGEYNRFEGSLVYDFLLSGLNITKHRNIAVSTGILNEFMKENVLNDSNPAEIVTRAMALDILRRGGLGMNQLLKAESERNYPETAEQGRVIVADTRLAVVDQGLKDKISARERVGFRELLNGSVQLWSNKIAKLGLQEVCGFKDVFYWTHAYDPECLGYMEGVFKVESFINDPEARIF